MKKILLVRHAKSSWNDFSISDHDRPLNDRGHHDAPLMAKKIIESEFKTEAIYTSSAKRAKDTAKYFSTILEVDNNDFHVLPRLYHPTPDTILDVINEADDKYESIALFCHNPGVTHFASDILNQYIDNVATCGVIIMSSDASNWSEVNSNNLHFINYFYPKM
jgi:phosphohistidine phosphatase